MSKKINNEKLHKYKKEIKDAFNSYEPENNGTLNINHLNNIGKINNSNKNNQFISDSLKSLTSQKKEEKEELISCDEYISFFDEQLSDINTKEGLEKIFNALTEGNNKSISWNNFPLIMKELGNDDMADNLMKLIEGGKLFNKEMDFEEFCGIMNEDYDKQIKSPNESEDYEMKESYKDKKNTKDKLKNKEESEEIITLSSKNEDNKSSIENNETEKSNKRYHRRYRDTKNIKENKESGNSTNNKIHTKYRKKK